MTPELKALLDREAEKNWLKISAEEISATNEAIKSFISEIENSQSDEEGEDLLNQKFGSSKNSIFHLAARFGDEENMRRILELVGNDKYCLDITNDGLFTPLHFAAKNGHLAVVEILIAAGAEKTPQASAENRRWVPIHYAAQFGHDHVVEALIGAGVDKEIKTGFGLTPLLIAAEFGQLNVVQFLLAIGAEKNVQTIDDNHRMTALHYAAVGNYKDVATALLEAGSDYSKETIFGLNALEFAAKSNAVDVLLLLMGWGSDKWESAMKIAQENKSSDAVKKIESYQKAKKNLFDAKWLKSFSAALLGMLKQFSRDNFNEVKIILAEDVSFNIYGLLSLKCEFGLFKKTSKTFLQFLLEGNHLELSAAVGELQKILENKK